MYSLYDLEQRKYSTKCHLLHMTDVTVSSLVTDHMDQLSAFWLRTAQDSLELTSIFSSQNMTDVTF